MMNRLQSNNQPWRNSQQINNPVFKSPQKPHLDNYNSNPFYHGEKENQNSIRNMGANNINKQAKPLISPKKMQNSQRLSQNNLQNYRPQVMAQPRYNQNNITERSQNGVNCANHPTKRAEFLVLMDDCEEQQYFCGRCAAQLATQGCEVQKIQSGNQSMGMKLSKKSDLPHFPQYQNEPIYQQIMDILKMCNGVVGEHNQNIERFSGLQKEYQHQIELTTTFYDRLIQIIEQMKTDHIYDLSMERDKYTQIADIENDNLRQNIIEINVIKNDIENHLEEVIEGIRQSGDTAECKESLEHYRQKLTLFRHQIQEQIQTLKEVTHYSENKMDKMIDEFQDFLKQLWDDKEEDGQNLRKVPCKNLNSAMTVKNIHQILPKGVSYENCQGKRAFRNLEDDEDQNLHDRKSPNFKKI